MDNSEAIDSTNGASCHDLSKNDIFDVLRNERRRGIIEVLHKHGEMSIRDISEYIADMGIGDETNNKLRKSIYISLIQTHIPKLENLGIIEYDRHNDAVKLLPNVENVTLYMEVVRKGNLPWSTYYLLICGISLAGAVLIMIGAIKLVTAEYWMLAILILLFISSIIHYADNRRG